MKRIKPAVFAPYDLSVENYTSLLWLFEGFTSYYDDLILVRSGLISADDYFGMLGKVIGGVRAAAGARSRPSPKARSTRGSEYYRQDENAPNAIVSYYTKGSLVALSFDLAIRAQTGHRKSLDDVMRLLWQRFGRDFYRGKPVGVEEGEVEALIAEATGVQLGELFAQAVHGTRDLPLETLLEPFGVTIAPEPRQERASRRSARVCAAAPIARWPRSTKAAQRRKPALGRRRADRARRPARDGHESGRAARALSAGREGRSARVSPRRAAHRATSSWTGRKCRATSSPPPTSGPLPARRANAGSQADCNCRPV